MWMGNGTVTAGKGDLHDNRVVRSNVVSGLVVSEVFTCTCRHALAWGANMRNSPQHLIAIMPSARSRAHFLAPAVRT